jgi:hypothetical protein
MPIDHFQQSMLILLMNSYCVPFVNLNLKNKASNKLTREQLKQKGKEQKLTHVQSKEPLIAMIKEKKKEGSSTIR